MAAKSSKNTTATKAKKTNGKAHKVAAKTGKTAKVIAMLKRPSGTTRKEILAVTGWKAVSVQQVAATAGLKVKMEKVAGKPIIYRV